MIVVNLLLRFVAFHNYEVIDVGVGSDLQGLV